MLSINFKSKQMANVNCVFHKTQTASWTDSGFPLCQTCADARLGKNGNDAQQHMLKMINHMIQQAKPDPVNHPNHYTSGKIEVIDFILDQGLNFCRGNAVKYVSRAGKKDVAKEIEDLKKAIWYIQREIDTLSGK